MSACTVCSDVLMDETPPVLPACSCVETCRECGDTSTDPYWIENGVCQNCRD